MLRSQAITVVARRAAEARRSCWPDVCEMHTSTACLQDDHGGRNILAYDQDEEELERESSRSRLEEARARMGQEPVWSGDERVQDTILRMLMDKHQPLRVKGGGSAGAGADARQHPSDAKLSTIQQPTYLSTTPNSSASSSSAKALESANAVAAGPHEDGRRLAKTPADKPWLAVYVNPLTEGGGQAGPGKPSIHYGRHLKSYSKQTAKGKDRLKMAGVRIDSLPLEDGHKMRAIRESVKKWDRAGRMRGVKEEAMEYRRKQGDLSSHQAYYEPSEEVDGWREEDILKEGQEAIRPTSKSDAKPGEAFIAMTGGRGWTSIANERIEEAMKTDYFRRNPLRGKPLVKDNHEMNPFLGREERIMNRLIQRQGASPPYVELNGLVESEMISFRKRLQESWIRRASRIILATDHLRRGMEPIASIHASSLTAGQRKLVNLARTYRDREWVDRERSFHEASIAELNSHIRRYNIVAPPSVRKGLVERQAELESMYDRASSDLALTLGEGLVSKAKVEPPTLGVSSYPNAPSSWWQTNLSRSTSFSPSAFSSTGRAGISSEAGNLSAGANGDDILSEGKGQRGSSSRRRLLAFTLAADLVRRARQWVSQ